MDVSQADELTMTQTPDTGRVAPETLVRGAGTLCSAQYSQTTADRVLAAAAWLFCHHGFQATGVDAIARRAGTAKTSLYKHFGNKDRLIEAVLEREGASWRAWFFAEIARVDGTAEAQLLALFDVLQLWFADPHFFGCPFINAAGEFDMHNGRLRKIITAHKSHLNGWIAAQAALLGDKEPDRTVAYFTLLMDGAIVAAQISGKSEYAQHAKALAQLHLQSCRKPVGLL
jgi:AcrR family transcriptional regulator